MHADDAAQPGELEAEAELDLELAEERGEKRESLLPAGNRVVRIAKAASPNDWNFSASAPRYSWSIDEDPAPALNRPRIERRCVPGRELDAGHDVEASELAVVVLDERKPKAESLHAEEERTDGGIGVHAEHCRHVGREEEVDAELIDPDRPEPPVRTGMRTLMPAPCSK